MLRQTISLQIFQRLSYKNFAWSILEYFDPYDTYFIISFDNIHHNYLVLLSLILSQYEPVEQLHNLLSNTTESRQK